MIDYLGFTIHSTSLTLTIPPGKVQDLMTDGNVFLDTYKCSIRNFSRLIGRFAATDPGNDRAKVHIKALQTAKVSSTAVRRLRHSPRYTSCSSLVGYLR